MKMAKLTATVLALAGIVHAASNQQNSTGESQPGWRPEETDPHLREFMNDFHRVTPSNPPVDERGHALFEPGEFYRFLRMNPQRDLLEIACTPSTDPANSAYWANKKTF